MDLLQGSYLFTENKRKEIHPTAESSDSAPTPSIPSYISTLNTRSNPDILAPGGNIMKGNKYFKKR